jgi:hypothetical protein
VDDAQPRTFMGVLRIIAGFQDHFLDLQPDAINLWEPTGDQGLELDVDCSHRLLPLLDVKVGTSACLIVVGFGTRRNGRTSVCSPPKNLH